MECGGYCEIGFHDEEKINFMGGHLKQTELTRETLKKKKKKYKMFALHNTDRYFSFSFDF